LKQPGWIARITKFPYLGSGRLVSPAYIFQAAVFLPRKIPNSMRILPFPFRRSINAENNANDWSQDEIADFYRAHRLLVENGAGIGIDRGVTDIGEPWMVFFDGASQDVFLHVARIDSRCHLICDSLNLRLSASNINQLIAEFENSVRELLSIRAERSKNVVIHPAARIIMSISAIFLLFKLETGEAQAKTQQDKAEGGLESGSVRWNDKMSASIVRAQTAFGRVFESTDTPSHVALLAGAIIALELSRVAVQTESSQPIETKADDLVIQDKTPAPIFVADNHIVGNADKVELLDNNSYKIQRVTPAEYIVADPTNALDLHANQAPSKMLKLSEAGEVTSESVAAEPNPVMVKASRDDAQTGEATPETSTVATAKVSETSQDNEATKALKEFISFANGEEINSLLDHLSNDQNVLGHQKEINVDNVKEISALNIDIIDDKVGFFIETAYDDAKLYKLVKYFADAMQQYEFDYVSGSVLIEEKNVEALADRDIGLWTNVMADGSKFSIVGHAGLIDDVVTFFA
jgi:hypothetical protein